MSLLGEEAFAIERQAYGRFFGLQAGLRAAYAFLPVASDIVDCEAA